MYPRSNLWSNQRMDIGILAALAMLAIWAVATFAGDAPGWIHLLLTLGVFVLVWRVVVAKARSTTKRE